MRKLIIFILSLAGISYAQGDLSLSSFYRTHPRSGIVGLDSGYGLPFWGKWDGKNPLFGYLRPAANLSTAGSYNAYALSFDLYPISFLGGTISYEKSNNQKNYADLDCGQYQCQGILEKFTISGKLFYKFSSIFGQLQYEWSRYLSEESEKEFIVPGMAIAAKRRSDQILAVSSLLGKRLGSHTDLLLISSYAKAQATNQELILNTLNLAWRLKNFRLIAGSGIGKSSLIKNDLLLQVGLIWTPIRKIGW